MAVMELGDLFSEVSKFLRETLAREKLSSYAECCRQQLVDRFNQREATLLQAYIDMSCGSTKKRTQHHTNDAYEEFNNSSDADSKSNLHPMPNAYTNGTYNNTSLPAENIYDNNDDVLENHYYNEDQRKENNQKFTHTIHHEPNTNEGNIYANNDHDTEMYMNIEHSSEFEDCPYKQPTSILANTPVTHTKPSLPNKNPSSNSNSERNSIISFKKDSPDRTSDSSSFTSSSTRCDDSPEILGMSASALRRVAAKYGILGRRKRFMFMEHIKQYWAAVHNQTLFFFSSDKNCKPIYWLDITGYLARPVDISPSNKSDFRFELVSPGKDTYEYVTDKQCDMEKWISAINSYGKTTQPPKDWGAQLPTPPLRYDEPDSANRCLLEAEYETPGVLSSSQSIPALNVLKQHTLPWNQKQEKRARQLPLDINNQEVKRRNTCQGTTNTFTNSPKQARKLPSLPHQQETYDQPDPLVRPVVEMQSEIYEEFHDELYNCIDGLQHDSLPQKSTVTTRRLPLLPHEETYDRPEPPRPVVQAEFCSNINNEDHIVTQVPIYKNVDENNSQDDRTIYKNTNENDFQEDSNYYNLVPSYPEKETQQECIYDVIAEQRHRIPSPTNVPHSGPMKPPISIKPSTICALNEEFKAKLGGKKLSPVVSNKAPMFNKRNLKVVKPPVVNRSC